MLDNGGRQWGLTLTLAIVGLMLAAPVAAVTGPGSEPQVPDAPDAPGAPGAPGAPPASQVVAQGQGAAEDAARTVGEAAPDPNEVAPPDVPEAPETPDASAAGAAAGEAQARAEAVADEVAGRVVPVVIDVALSTARQARSQVDETVGTLPDLQAAPGGDETGEPAVAPQSAAALPEGTLAMAGSILVVGATAVAATYVVLWMAGSSGTLGAGAASATTSELRRLLPFASPLFTRFERDTVLGHPRREQLYARILQEPGISLQDLGLATGLSRTAVVHHLRLLEQQHLVISRRVGRSRHYFENGGRYGHDQKEAYAILRNGRSKAVADFIRSHPGTMQKSLCEALGIPPSIAHWHVRRLQEGGLVQSIRQGRAVAYFPGSAMATVSATPSLAAVAAPSPQA